MLALELGLEVGELLRSSGHVARKGEAEQRNARGGGFGGYLQEGVRAVGEFRGNKIPISDAGRNDVACLRVHGLRYGKLDSGIGTQALDTAPASVSIQQGLQRFSAWQAPRLADR